MSYIDDMFDEENAYLDQFFSAIEEEEAEEEAERQEFERLIQFIYAARKNKDMPKDYVPNHSRLDSMRLTYEYLRMILSHYKIDVNLSYELCETSPDAGSISMIGAACEVVDVLHFVRSFVNTHSVKITPYQKDKIQIALIFRNILIPKG